MAIVDIVRHRTGFCVRTSEVALHHALKVFNESLTQPKIQRQRGKVFTIPGDKYAVRVDKENAFYYADALYDSVITLLKERAMLLMRRGIEIRESRIEPYVGDTVSFKGHNLNMVEPEGDFFWQNACVDKCTTPEDWHNILEIATGEGKTKTALKIATKIGKRILLLTKAAYLDKWVGDLKENLNLRAGELYKVKDIKELEILLHAGGDKLKTGKDRKECKAIVISSHCIENYINEFKTRHDKCVHPTDLLNRLGIGLLIYDESHQFFRMNYTSFIMLNPPRVIDLSATLDPDDAFMKQRYLERFPPLRRYTGNVYIPFIDAIGLRYNINDHKVTSRMNRLSMYNHPELEKMIMRNKAMLNNYMHMCAEILKVWYVTDKQEGQKALIIFATKAMCTLFTEYMKRKYPKFDVYRYIEGDVYKKATQADIIVSTPGKSGTAVDYVGLVLAVITVAVDATQANLQMLGRTRKSTLKLWNMNPKVVYPICNQIKKHHMYWNKKAVKFQGRVRKLVTLGSSFVV